MIHPAEQARSHIMNALEACQASAALQMRLDELVRLLAKAQNRLFPAGQLPVESPGCIDMVHRAMETLAQALQILQDLNVDAEAVDIAAQSIAKALQLLHPVVHGAEKTEARISRRPTPRPYADAINVDTMLSTGSNHQIFNGFSQDIKDGGIFIATFDPRPIGEDVLVNFKLPSNRTVSASGVVHFVREFNPARPDTPPGMGVKFRHLTSSDKLALEQFLESRTAMFYDNS